MKEPSKEHYSTLEVLLAKYNLSKDLTPTGEKELKAIEFALSHLLNQSKEQSEVRLSGSYEGELIKFNPRNEAEQEFEIDEPKEAEESTMQWLHKWMDKNGHEYNHIPLEEILNAFKDEAVAKERETSQREILLEYHKHLDGFNDHTIYNAPESMIDEFLTHLKNKK